MQQGPERSDAKAQTGGPSVLSQALYHWATALPNEMGLKFNECKFCTCIDICMIENFEQFSLNYLLFFFYENFEHYSLNYLDFL